MAELTAPQQNRLLGQLANMLRATEGDIAAPEFLPKGLDVMGLVRQLMLPSAETVEKMSYGDPLFRMPMQSNIPITADREYLADIAGMIPFGAPAARPTARGIQDLVRQIQTEPPTGAISPEIAARVLPETKVASEANKPIVAYHATGKEVDQLDPAMASGKSAGTGTFFSSNPYTASTYALGESPNVIPAYLDFKRPMVVDAQGANWNRLNKKAKVDLPDAKQTTLGRIFGDEMRYVDDYASTDDLARYAKQQGYDGLVVRNVVDHGPAGRFSTDEALEPSDIYVAFDKQNIRSALSDEQMSGLLGEPAQSVAETSYRGSHSAPNVETYGATLDSLEGIMPADVYSSRGKNLYGLGNPDVDAEWFAAAFKAKGKPDAEVTIYRAVPKGVKEINSGDWVTTSKTYADMHGENAIGDDYEILSKKVKAKTLSSEGYPYEFGYNE